MNLILKKKLLSILSILNTICCCCYLGIDLVKTDSIFLVIFDFFLVLLAFLPFVYIRNIKKIKHLFFLILPFTLSGFFCSSIINFLISTIGIVVSFISSKEEKGILEKLIKKQPLFFSIIVIICGMTFLASSSFFKYLSQLTYGFDMLGEICATVFLFFMILVCNKGYLIYKNKGSIKESIIVSLPFIIYIFYIGSSLLASHIVEGYEFVSIENIIVVSLFYIFVGIFEDFLIRGLSLNILLEKYGSTKKGILLSVFLSSLFFGMIHFSNLFTGASFQGVLIQVITATCVGFYFSAIYLRSGNVWTPALLHGFYDVAVSISSFFVINEVVDTTVEYAESISNYSWANLVVGVVYLVLAAFLLRNKKMKNVVAMVNNKTIEKSNKDGALKYLFIGFGLGFSVFVCYISFVSMFQLDSLARETYEKLLTQSDYQEEYSLTYINEYVNKNSLSDEVKVLLAISNLEDDDYENSYSIEEAERDVLKEAIFTYIHKDKVDKSLKDIFNDIDGVNYVSINVSYKTSCNYDKNLSKYVCITTNNNQENNLRVYSNISNVSTTTNGDIEVLVYYLVEDVKSNVLYADSNLKTVYKFDSSIKDIVNEIDYDETDNRNRKFWKRIEEKNNGMIPTYKLVFRFNDTGDKMYFVSSEFLDDSIKKDNSVKEEVVINDIYQYNSSNYSFNYNKSYFNVEEEKNKLIVKSDNFNCLEIEIISSEKWLTKYKNFTFNSIILGDYAYYNYGNEYLIYKDNFYIITINTNNELEKNELLELVKSLKFN